jgi:hypothetical protein
MIEDKNWPRIEEPIRETIFRAVRIAIVVGTVCVLVRHKAGLFSADSLDTWAMTALLGLWLAFAGHWIELFYLNWLRQRLPGSCSAHVVTRLGVWFLGGTILTGGMVLVRPVEATLGLPSVPWWAGGVLFIGIELLMHLVALQFRGRPSFYNGQG